MRVLVSLTGIEYIKFFLSLAPQVWGRGTDIYGFAHSRRWMSEAAALGLPRDRVLYISEDRRRRLKDPVDYAYLRQVEATYGLPTLWPFVVAERLLSGKRYTDILKTLQVEFRLITEFLERVRPDAILAEGVAGLSTYIMWAWAQRNGVRPVYMLHPRLRNRFVVLDNPYDQWTAMERRLGEIQRRGLSPEERVAADAFLRHIVEQEIQPSYMTTLAPVFGPPHLLRDTLHGMRYVRSYIRYQGWRDYTTRAPWDYAGDRANKLIRALAYRGRLVRPFEEPRQGEPYVVFPLQVFPEASLSVRAPFLTDPVALIETIARSLPVGYRLYVKEHVAAWWSRPLALYRKLRRIPNVRLISPFVHPHGLVRGASAVATITSTMGWEALLYGKPLVTFGRAFYNACPLVRHVAAPDELPGVMRELLTIHTPDREVLLQFLAAVLAGTYPGEIDAYTPEFLHPDNVSLVAAGVRRELDLGTTATRPQTPAGTSEAAASPSAF